MKIIDFRKVDKGKLRAFFSVEWPDKLVIRDCKLIENANGELFAAMPSRQYEHNGEKKWTNIVHILDLSILNRITEKARAAYDEGGTKTRAAEGEVPF